MEIGKAMQVFQPTVGAPLADELVARQWRKEGAPLRQGLSSSGTGARRATAPLAVARVAVRTTAT